MEFLAVSAAACALPLPARAASLHARVADIASSVPGIIGVFARTLSPGGTLVAYRASEVFPTASIIKVLIMTTAYVAEERTPGALRAAVRFDRASDLIGGSDFMQGRSDGERFTVAELIQPMITVSDNSAANMLIRHFGIGAINAVGKRVGMHHTRLGRAFMDTGAIVRHHDNVSTPSDMARLLYIIERGAHEAIPTIVSADHCRAMVQTMLQQTDREKIPGGLPRGVPVANKTGEITGTRNDVAIVRPFGNAPFVLAIMTRDLSDYAAANAAIHQIARATYDEA